MVLFFYGGCLIYMEKLDATHISKTMLVSIQRNKEHSTIFIEKNRFVKQRAHRIVAFVANIFDIVNLK